MTELGIGLNEHSIGGTVITSQSNGSGSGMMHTDSAMPSSPAETTPTSLTPSPTLHSHPITGTDAANSNAAFAASSEVLNSSMQPSKPIKDEWTTVERLLLVEFVHSWAYTRSYRSINLRDVDWRAIFTSLASKAYRTPIAASEIYTMEACKTVLEAILLEYLFIPMMSVPIEAFSVMSNGLRIKRRQELESELQESLQLQKLIEASIALKIEPTPPPAISMSPSFQRPPSIPSTVINTSTPAASPISVSINPSLQNIGHDVSMIEILSPAISIRTDPLHSPAAVSQPSQIHPKLESLPSTPIAASPTAIPPPPLPGTPAYRSKLLSILRSLQHHPEAEPFLEPVRDEDAPNYSVVIISPMDFSTIETMITNETITTASELHRQFLQVFSNCYTYNDRKTTYYKQARNLDIFASEHLRTAFPEDLNHFLPNLEARKISGRPPKGRASMPGDYKSSRRSSTVDLSSSALSSPSSSTESNSIIKSEDLPLQSPHFSLKQFPTPKMEPISIDENNKGLKGSENPKSVNKETDKIQRTATISSRPTIRTSGGGSTIDNGSSTAESVPKKVIPPVSADGSSIKSPSVAPRTPGTRKRNATDMDDSISPLISATTPSAAQTARGARKRVEREEEVAKEEVKNARRGRPRKGT